MAASKQSNAITLKGSTEMVAEFFRYGINSILYQRGVYPAGSFERMDKYELTLFLTNDPVLNDYLTNVLKQVKEWLCTRTIQRIVLVIKNVDSHETLERWQFNIECDKDITEDSKPVQKPLKAIQKEIRDVIRQITASVTFLPLLDGPCAFDLLMYTSRDLEVPEMWEESGPQIIANSQEVRLRSFSTAIHKVDTMVSYKSED